MKPIRRVEPSSILSVALVFVALSFASALASAESPVGLEAQGVSLEAALHNNGNLDVRDVLGRPVSAQLIAQQMKAASAQAAVQASYVSRLPQVKTIMRMLELLQAVKLALKSGHPTQPWHGAFAIAISPRPSPEIAFVIVINALFISFLALTYYHRCSFSHLDSSLCKLVVLRC